jgi:hypothetical protein
MIHMINMLPPLPQIRLRSKASRICLVSDGVWNDLGYKISLCVRLAERVTGPRRPTSGPTLEASLKKPRDHHFLTSP